MDHIISSLCVLHLTPTKFSFMWPFLATIGMPLPLKRKRGTFVSPKLFSIGISYAFKYKKFWQTCTYRDGASKEGALPQSGRP